jgi:acetylornithine deacetylase/succinyl-diaminopimelate desuccinylase-like protein
MKLQIEELRSEYDKNQDRYIAELGEFLSIPSISTDPKYLSDCQRCAAWLSAHLEKLGFKSEILETTGKPVVLAKRVGKPGSTRVLFYGHYDVQPVDPITGWASDPFKAELRGAPNDPNRRIFARGAQDNKGQLFYFVKAAETLIQKGALDLDLTLLIEGEEESGSRGLSASLDAWQGRLEADALLVCDTGTLQAGLPAITMGLRGIAAMTVTVKGPAKDLHSGVHGGVARNPATELCRLVASLHDNQGRIAVPGYYDEVTEPSKTARDLANKFPLTAEQYQALTGAPPLGGELGLTPAERRGFRPTIEINGIHSGYGGPGGKTIIPAEAFIKISCRLVVGQDPQRALDRIKKHLVANTPAGVQISFSEERAEGIAVALDPDSNLARRAASCLKLIDGVDPLFIWEGASIPVVAELAKVSGAEPLMVGFGLEEDNIHAPNESFALSQFRAGYLYSAMILQELGS